MAIYNDQALGNNFDPSSAWSLPTSVTVISITLDDANNDGVLSANSGDQINGSNITSVYVGDQITLNGVIITGVTFYTADGSRYFTPNDGAVLTAGTVTATNSGFGPPQMPVGDLGPPCFASGTMISTPNGEVLIEDLQIGGLVLTKDHGAQPIRWMGRRKVAGRGDFAPILFKAGAIGNARDLRVSPQHRMLLKGWRSELYFGEAEVLCAANRLINHSTIISAPCDQVEYIHMMFDQHEVIFAEGAASESFLVGEYLTGEGTALLAELRALFPDLDTSPACKTPARRIARGFEVLAASG